MCPPCHYEETAEEIRARKQDAVAKLLKPYKKKLDDLTRMLCATLQAVEDVKEPLRQMNRYVALPREVRAWAKKHKQEDARRARR